MLAASPGRRVTRTSPPGGSSARRNRNTSDWTVLRALAGGASPVLGVGAGLWLMRGTAGWIAGIGGTGASIGYAARTWSRHRSDRT
jgi:hypothetical protein